jgi:hypothetical protein
MIKRIITKTVARSCVNERREREDMEVINNRVGNVYKGDN